MNHLQAVNTLASERYLLDEMTELERHAFEEHFFSCPDCAGDVRLAAVMRDAARAGLAGVERIGRRRHGLAPLTGLGAAWRWRPSIAVPWAAAAALALIVAYQGVQSGFPKLGNRPDIGPFELAPVTLRPATRGEEPAVRTGPGGLITLAVDLGGARFEGGIRCQLRRADGAVVSTGEPIAKGKVISTELLPAPPPGTPLLLLIPAGILNPSAHYLLTLQNLGSAVLTSEDYRFTVEAR